MRSTAPATPAPAVAAGDEPASHAPCVDRRCMLAAATAGAAAVVLSGCSALGGGNATTSAASGGNMAGGNGQAVAGAGQSAGGDAMADPNAAVGSDGNPINGTADGAAAGTGQEAEAAPTKAATKVKGKTLTKLASIPVGGGIVLAAQKIVVTRPDANTVKAFSAVCTHQGCTVNKVANGTIDCPCHGAKFDVADGTPTAGPAKKPLAPVKVAISGANVVKI